MSFKTTKMDRGVVWTFFNVMTGQDIINSSTAVYSLPDFGNMRFQIVDMRSVDSVDVDPGDMEIVSGMDMAASGTNPYILVAIIAKNPDQAQPLIDAYSSLGEGPPWKTELFSTLQEAISWINGIYSNCIVLD